MTSPFSWRGHLAYLVMLKGKTTYHFRGKVIYNLPFSKNHNLSKNIHMHIRLKQTVFERNMAQNGLKMGILGHFCSIFHKIYYVAQY